MTNFTAFKEIADRFEKYPRPIQFGPYGDYTPRVNDFVRYQSGQMFCTGRRPMHGVIKSVNPLIVEFPDGKQKTVNIHDLTPEL